MVLMADNDDGMYQLSYQEAGIKFSLVTKICTLGGQEKIISVL